MLSPEAAEGSRDERENRAEGAMAGNEPQDQTVTWNGGTPGQPASAGGAYSAGDLLGSRYRIVRFVAAGGVGEVYEAHDEELDQRVALKTIRRSRADAEATERLKREIQLARQVTHPNV